MEPYVRAMPRHSGDVRDARPHDLQQRRADCRMGRPESRLPSRFAYRDHVEAGGLVSYGPNICEMPRQASAQSRAGQMAFVHRTIQAQLRALDESSPVCGGGCMDAAAWSGHRPVFGLGAARVVIDAV